MKKALAIIVALVLLVGVFAACGNQPAAPSTPSTPDSGASTPSTPDAGTTPPPADDKVYTLTVHSHDPEVGVTGDFLKAWAASVEEASGGRLKFNIYHGGSLGGPLDTIDMTTNGTVNGDYLLSQAILLLFAVITVVCNFITDLVYHKFDPRVKEV